MAMAVLIVLVGCYYGYNASGGPIGVGTATAKSMVVNLVGVHLISMLGTQLFSGANPRAPIGGIGMSAEEERFETAAGPLASDYHDNVASPPRQHTEKREPEIEEMLSSDNPFIRQFLAGDAPGPPSMD